MKTWQSFWSVAFILAAMLFTSGCSDQQAEIVEEATPETTQPEPAVEAPPAKRVFVFSEASKIQFGLPEDAENPKGGFSNFVGKLEVAGDGLVPDGKHSITIDMSSVFTDDEKQTELLKGDDLLANTFFPIARLSVSQAAPAGEGLFNLTGTFEFHGTSKELTFPATVKSSGGGNQLDLSAEVPINWKDFGVPGSEELKWEETVLRLELVSAPGEPRSLELTPVSDGSVVTRIEGTQARRPGGGGFGGQGGKGRADWRNMSEEERAERRRQFIAEMDKNGDGNLGKDEMSERMWQFMGQADTNGDDQVSESERTAYRAKREAERAERELNGEEPRRFGRGGDGKGGGFRGKGGDGKGQ